MAERYEIKTVSTPAGTAIATPIITDLVWRQGYPVKVEIRIPPGPSGLLGLQLLHSGQQIIPFSRNDWLVTDDEMIAWDLDGYPYNSKWALRSYNTDVYPHAVQIRMALNEVGTEQLESRVPAAILPPWQSGGQSGEGEGF